MNSDKNQEGTSNGRYCVRKDNCIVVEPTGAIRPKPGGREAFY